MTGATFVELRNLPSLNPGLWGGDSPTVSLMLDEEKNTVKILILPLLPKWWLEMVIFVRSLGTFSEQNKVQY